jgi:hypothetical protein
MTATRRILSTFDLRPTTAPRGAKPDELMINWTTLPVGSSASLYMPGLNADDIIAESAALYGYRPFGKVGRDTMACAARGIVYLPIPRAPGNVAGLLDVTLPKTVRAGESFTISVHQLTNQSARIPIDRNPVVDSAMFIPPTYKSITWRKAIGAFKLGIAVKSEKQTLPIVERNLSLLRWIFQSIPADSRWRPIFERYLGALAQEVSGLGGDPGKIPASGTGVWSGGPHSHGGGSSGHPGDGGGPAPTRHRDRQGFVGKVDGLIFDHFGDFEGFVLETETGERLHFYSRAENLRKVVERAWASRLRVTVFAEDASEDRPRRIVLHPAPDPL